MKVGADKVRTDVSPQMSTITDTKTGDITTLMHQQKSFMVISAATSKAMMDQMAKAMQQMGGITPGAPKLQATGKKDKVNGYDTDEYTFANGNIKGTYWIASAYPNAKEITAAMAKFQQGGLAGMTREFTPDFSGIAGVPIKSEVDLNGQKIVTQLESAKDEPADPTAYQVPTDYTEMKMPGIPAP